MFSLSVQGLETLEKTYLFLDLIQGLEILEFYRVILVSREFYGGQFSYYYCPICHDEYQQKGKRATGLSKRAAGLSKRATSLSKRTAGLSKRTAGLSKRAAGLSKQAAGVSKWAAGPSKRASGLSTTSLLALGKPTYKHNNSHAHWFVYSKSGS